MAENTDDTGVVVALMQRFNEQRLPEALSIRERVEAGERLSEHDVAFLEKVFSDANDMGPFLEKHPDLQPVVSRAVSLYKEITEKALENEKQS